jgi:uncharacterized RDD family membrane protein YckC
VAAPEKLIIETPEQISLEYTLASAGSRFLALAIDTLLQLAVTLLLGLLALVPITLSLGSRDFSLWVIAALWLLWFAVYYGYFAFFEASWSGQTPGKRAVALRVMTVSGRPITAFDAILRNLLRIVDQLPGIYAVGIVSIFLTARNQRLGDLAAGTVVVHDQPLRHDHVTPVLASGAPRLGADRLQPNELEAMELFLKRRNDLPIWRRDRAARELAKHVRMRLAIPVDQQPSDEGLLEELVAEYRSRGRSR